MSRRAWVYASTDRKEMSQRAQDYRSTIARLNGARGRLGMAYGQWSPGRDATATRPALPARQAVYGIYDVDKSTGDISRVYVECEGHREPGGVLISLPPNGSGSRQQARFWLCADDLSSLVIFGDGAE